MVEESANGGVFYRWSAAFDRNKRELLFAPEYQIIDNKTNGDGLTPETSCGSVFSLYAPSRDATKPAGQWNSGQIVVAGTHVEHWVNGERVLAYDLDSEDGKQRVAKNEQFQSSPEFGRPAAKGRIAFQSFAREIRYRDLRIRP